jgi:hypothetical protein
LYVDLRLFKDDKVLGEYTFFWSSTLFSEKDQMWLRMSDDFAATMQKSVLDMGGK